MVANNQSSNHPQPTVEALSFQENPPERKNYQQLQPSNFQASDQPQPSIKALSFPENHPLESKNYQQPKPPSFQASNQPQPSDEALSLPENPPESKYYQQPQAPQKFEQPANYSKQSRSSRQKTPSIGTTSPIPVKEESGQAYSENATRSKPEDLPQSFTILKPETRPKDVQLNHMSSKDVGVRRITTNSKPSCCPCCSIL